MKFNERLMALRKKWGLSQEELGFELGVSRQTVSKWESGQSYPDFQRLVLLADYFDISLDELVRGLDVGDVRALNESEKQLSSIYADVEGGKAVMRKYIRVLLGIGAAILAFFAGIVCYAVLFA
ncbi:helix-turn-helix domain-containing protein [Adlercreutzia muris]|uniref:helix-turn-helix domain-containing protein n=1 Tax=Adlercreutzia muris TaxID=1796610 RepID=UPI003517756F